MKNKGESKWIDVYDDDLMVKLGMRQPPVVPKYKNVWTKTTYEQKSLRIERSKNNKKTHFFSSVCKEIPVRDTLIIHLKKNKKFPKTTYSIKCWQNEIGDILLKYYYNNHKTGNTECLVSKYYYNGRTYSPEERPFWPGN